MEIADDFPRFQAPGYEQDMDLLRSLHWLHYGPAKPLATLWDEWLSGPTLWPALHTGDAMETIRKQWSDALSGRIIDAEGYVATHQHASIAHQLGWPFPSWNMGDGGCGWHFSFKDTAPPPWRGEELSTPTGWETDGVRDDGIGEDGWRLTIAAPRAARRARHARHAPRHIPGPFHTTALAGDRPGECAAVSGMGNAG